MRTIRLTEAQYSLLSAFVEQAAGYDSVQDTLVEAGMAALGLEDKDTDTEEEGEAKMLAVIALQNSMWEALATAEETPDAA